MSRPPLSVPSIVKIEPVSDPSDISALASLFDVSASASGDTFHELLRRYTDDPHGQLVEQLKAACCSSTGPTSTTDGERSGTTATALQQQFVFKAVVVVEETASCTSVDGAPDDRRQESASGYGEDDDPGVPGVQQEDQAPVKKEKNVVVGMAHWTVGYIDLQPKVDPFRQEQQQRLPLATSSSAPVGAEGDSSSAQAVPLEDPIVESSGGGGPAAASSQAEWVGQPFDFYAVVRRPVRNTYISQIRGKKHVYLRRIAVHPRYQHRGIARQLLQWGLDRADAEKLVSYLNARPIARRLYESAGFEVVNTVPMVVPGLEVPDMIAMVRQPRGLGSG